MMGGLSGDILPEILRGMDHLYFLTENIITNMMELLEK
ncbi:non-LEE-encoded type III secreted effector domain protein [Escherichia coli DEC3F]|nr:non-LEE-encoded type III secreted effector domain protein [Escherichia coli DEC3F]